jgi:two-component system nitrate/nitrite response regulator NarL
MRLKIVVVDDNPAVLNQLVSILEPETELEVAATAENGLLALECVRRHRPDVVVADLGMPILNGVELTKELKKMPSHPAVVICSVENDPEIVKVALQAGALGYVFKTYMDRDLIKAVKLAAQGESFVSSS